MRFWSDSILGLNSMVHVHANTVRKLSYTLNDNNPLFVMLDGKHYILDEYKHMQLTSTNTDSLNDVDG